MVKYSDKNQQEINCILDKTINSLKERISQIDYNQELFNCETRSREDGQVYIEVLYNTKVYLRIIPYLQYYKQNGHRTAYGAITIKCANDSRWYYDDNKINLILINESLCCKLDTNLNVTLEEFQNKYLPISNKNYVKLIVSELNDFDIKNADISFDTINQRYVVQLDICNILQIEKNDIKNKELTLCKYMSLDTYLCVLKSKKIRLNSIVSMNDTSESFYLGEYLCNAYDDKQCDSPSKDYNEESSNGLRYRKTVEHKNALIMSLSDQIDDAMMWRLYGNNGKGICMSFLVKSTKVIPINYTSEENGRLCHLREAVKRIESNGINLYFSDIDKYMYVVKSQQFEYEHEYRIVKECSNDHLDITKYGDLISVYKDFSFEELGLKPICVCIGSNLPNRDTNYPLLVDLSNRNLNIHDIEMSKVDKLRD